MVLARIILGLLALGPMTGYDVKRHIDSTIAHFWAADKAQIYRTLAALVDDGYATVERVAGSGAPDRQEHRITERGREALHAWLLSDLERQPERDAFLARLFFAGSLDSTEAATLLARRRAAAEQQLTTFERMRDGLPAPADREARFRWATLENGIAHARAELAWLDDTAESLA